MCPKEHPCVMEQQKRSWHWLYTDTAAARCQLQNKLQWKTLSSMYLLALICIHPWVNWHLKLERVLSCCQMPVAKQTSMETKLSSSYLLALICIHPLYLVNWHLKLERAHSCQLPCSCKTNFNGNICHPCIYSHWFAFIQSICQLTSETPTCTQLPAAVAKQTSMEKTVIQNPESSYLLIDLHSSTFSSQLTSETPTCTQLPAAVAKQTAMEKNCHPVLYIDLHSSMGQLTSETRTCTQLLPDASCKTNFNGNKTVIQLSTRIDLHSSNLSVN